MSDWRKLSQSPDQWATLTHDDPRLDDFAHEVEARYGLPFGVVEALKNAGERTPRAATGWATSPKGAQGVMQFMPGTRKDYPHNVDDPFESIDAAGRYMQTLLRQYDGNVMAAVAHYNGGWRAGKAVLAGKPPPAAETRGYLDRISKYMDKKYGGN
jgi:hypothetical protein